jgi:DNA repair protein RecO (recombination protein O)
MHSTQGIILKKHDVGEADAIFVIYTKDFGKIRAVAQGVKKESAKLKGHLESLSLASIQFIIGKNGERLTHAEMQEYWPALRHDKDKLKTAWHVAELINSSCLEGEKDENIWNLLVSSFSILNKEIFSEGEMEKFSKSVEERLLQHLGVSALGIVL